MRRMLVAGAMVLATLLVFLPRVHGGAGLHTFRAVAQSSGFFARLSLVSSNAALPSATVVVPAWWVAWQVQNVGDQEATLQVQAVPADGTSFSTSSASLPLAAGAATTFVPGNVNALTPPLEEGFIGSVVLSADQPIVAIGNVANNPIFDLGVEGGSAAAQYQAASGHSTATQLSFPLMKNDFAGQTTTFYIQAAGEVAIVTMTYRTNDGGVYTDGPYVLDSDEMHVFMPDDAGVPKGCASPSSTASCVGSAVAISSAGPIVGIYAEYPTGAGPAPFAMSTRGFTPQDADTMVAVPVIKHQWVGRTSALTVQNAEVSADVRVNVTFRGVAGDCAGRLFSGDEAALAPGTSVIYFPNLHNMAGLPTNCFSSAVVNAEGGKVVAVVSEAGAGKKTAYSAFSVRNATKKVALPLVKRAFAGRTTGVVIQNVGDGPTEITAAFHVVRKPGGDGPGNFVLGPAAIPPGEAITLDQLCRRWFPSPCAVLEGTKSSVVITSSSENIVALAQESGIGIDVDIKNYEGFNIGVSE